MNTNSSFLLSILKEGKSRRKWRMLKDQIAKYSMTLGGISIIIAITLIFFYLFYVVLPLFLPASMNNIVQFSTPNSSMGNTIYLASEEKNELGVRFTNQADVIFFGLKDGNVISKHKIAIPEDASITSFAVADPATDIVAFGLNDGRAVVVKHDYKITYPNDIRVITPSIKYPLGKTPIVVDEKRRALSHLDIQLKGASNTLAAITADNNLVLAGFSKEESFLGESSDFERTSSSVLALPSRNISHLLLDKEQKVIYLADQDGQISHIDISGKIPKILMRLRVVDANTKITALEFLTGDISLLVGDSQGRITQWFPVRDKNNNHILTKIREFNDQSAPIVSIASEERRKGFAAADSSGEVGIYHSTAHRTVMLEKITDVAIKHVSISPRADRLLVADDNNQFHVWNLHNEHPEISLSALWGKVWYESYESPDYVWQSSSANNDFEPKFSLVPLAFGTLKAAFYAMLIAIPIAVFGAIYTAYFMAPQMRAFVKPTIEIMEALPTVILGFLAGLWLAPIVEKSLPGFLMLLLFLPIGVLAFAFIMNHLPKSVKNRISVGWQSVLLIPVILFVTWLAFSLSYPVESTFFGGNMPNWLTNELGVDFDQRNSIIVGIAMGLAVIPTIFSMTEDAVFSVPKHLTMGSLALGATPWQTMIRVVILTASPGIFSAIMIGMGRAVGETMIVLMATGNTPIMDFNIFEGLRTLSANIAVEMPESEVASTHYRILFLSGLVLFIFTFFFNTIAEIVRHRLRRKYSSL